MSNTIAVNRISISLDAKAPAIIERSDPSDPLHGVQITLHPTDGNRSAFTEVGRCEFSKFSGQCLPQTGTAQTCASDAQTRAAQVEVAAVHADATRMLSAAGLAIHRDRTKGALPYSVNSDGTITIDTKIPGGASVTLSAGTDGHGRCTDITIDYVDATGRTVSATISSTQAHQAPELFALFHSIAKETPSEEAGLVISAK